MGDGLCRLTSIFGSRFVKSRVTDMLDFRGMRYQAWGLGARDDSEHVYSKYLPYASSTFEAILSLFAERGWRFWRLSQDQL